jgi:hypothetical protein
VILIYERVFQLLHTRMRVWLKGKAPHMETMFHSPAKLMALRLLYMNGIWMAACSPTQVSTACSSMNPHLIKSIYDFQAMRLCYYAMSQKSPQYPALSETNRDLLWRPHIFIQTTVS